MRPSRYALQGSTTRHQQQQSSQCRNTQETNLQKGRYTPEPYTYPDEIPGTECYERGVKRIAVNAYERNPAAREACLKVHGYSCHVCHFDFAQFYGKIGEQFIHVHHLRQLSGRGKRHKVNPINDLRPGLP